MSDLDRDSDDPKEYRKSMHDGRKQFFAVLEKMQIAQEGARITGDLEMWYRSIAAVYGKVREACRDEDTKRSIDDGMKTARELYNAQRRFRSSRMLRYPQVAAQYAKNDEEFDNILSEVHDLIHDATLELMLPLKQDDDADFDVDKALRGSGT